MSCAVENHMVLPLDRKHYDGECPTCGTEFETSGRPQADEDGSPIYQHATTDCPICDHELCGRCKDNGKAFVCETCGLTFCTDHRKTVAGEHYCPACYVAALEAAYESAEADLSAAKRELAAYEAACARIAAIYDEQVEAFIKPEHRDTALLGRAAAIAKQAPVLAEEAALKAA